MRTKTLKSFQKSAILSLLIIITCSGELSAQRSTSQLYKDVAPAVVLIRTESGGGTGFFVSSDGLVVTSHHVIYGRTSVTIQTADGREFDGVELLAVDIERDLAVLKVSAKPKVFLELSDKEASVGDSIVVIGNPLAAKELAATISTGIVSGLRNLTDNTRILQITAPVSPGNSGGPVFSDDGKVIGVISFKLPRGDALNFAIRSEYAKKLMTDARSQKGVKFTGTQTPKDTASVLPTRVGKFDLNGLWERNDGERFIIRDIDGKIQLFRLSAFGLSPSLAYEAEWQSDFAYDVGRNLILIPKDTSTILWTWDFESKKQRKEREKADTATSTSTSTSTTAKLRIAQYIATRATPINASFILRKIGQP